MNLKFGWMLTVAALALAPARVFAAKAEAAALASRDAKTLIASWPELTRAGAEELIAKYGPPDSASDDRLAWNNKDKWRVVAVYRDAVKDDDEAETPRFVVNELNYTVPDDKAAAELIRFDRGLVIDQVRGTIAAQGDSEKYNMLVLNLADEIATGKRTLTAAQTFFRKTQKAIAAGKKFTYLDEIRFASGAGDGVSKGAP